MLRIANTLQRICNTINGTKGINSATGAESFCGWVLGPKGEKNDNFVKWVQDEKTVRFPRKENYNSVEWVQDQKTVHPPRENVIPHPLNPRRNGTLNPNEKENAAEQSLSTPTTHVDDSVPRSDSGTTIVPLYAEGPDLVRHRGTGDNIPRQPGDPVSPSSVYSAGEPF